MNENFVIDAMPLERETITPDCWVKVKLSGLGDEPKDSFRIFSKKSVLSSNSKEVTYILSEPVKAIANLTNNEVLVSAGVHKFYLLDKLKGLDKSAKRAFSDLVDEMDYLGGVLKIIDK